MTEITRFYNCGLQFLRDQPQRTRTVLTTLDFMPVISDAKIDEIVSNSLYSHGNTLLDDASDRVHIILKKMKTRKVLIKLFCRACLM